MTLKMIDALSINDTENHIKIDFTHAFPLCKGYLMHSWDHLNTRV